MFSVVVNEEIVGGAIVFINANEMYVDRIFVNPIYFRKGYGLLIMEKLEKFSGIKMGFGYT